MPNYFVKYREPDSKDMVVLHGRPYTELSYMRAVTAADEESIRRNASRISRRKNPVNVEIVEIIKMDADQERVFSDTLLKL